MEALVVVPDAVTLSGWVRCARARSLELTADLTRVQLLFRTCALEEGS